MARGRRSLTLTVVAAVFAVPVVILIATSRQPAAPILAGEKAAQAQEPAQTEAAPAQPTPVRPVQDLSPAEIALLQDLAERRRALDRREASLETRERVLAEAIERADQKIRELAKLEEELMALVEEQEGRDEEELKSLVRIYERMRPRDAARLIEDLDPDLQLEVAIRMRAIRMAQILSVMDPQSASDLTARMAERSQLPPAGR